MNIFKASVLLSLITVAGSIPRAIGQVNILANDITLNFASAISINVDLGNNPIRAVIPTPFKIANLSGYSANQLWFCMDPAQTIYWQGNDYVGQIDIYNNPTNDPSAFNNWETGAVSGGLSTAKKQDLANLFTAYESFQYSQYGSVSLQLAVWEIVNEHNPGSYNLSDAIPNQHSFSISKTDNTMPSNYNTAYTSIVNTANDMLAKLNTWGSGTAHGNTNYITYLLDGYSDKNSTTICDYVPVQDLLGWTPPIPESSNFATGGLGLLGLAAIGKWRRLKKSQNANAAPV